MVKIQYFLFFILASYSPFCLSQSWESLIKIEDPYSAISDNLQSDIEVNENSVLIGIGDEKNNENYDLFFIEENNGSKSIQRLIFENVSKNKIFKSSIALADNYAALAFIDSRSNGLILILEKKPSGQWNIIQAITAPEDAKYPDKFGTSIDLHDDLLAVGSLSNQVFIFNRDNSGEWSYHQTIKIDKHDRFIDNYETIVSIEGGNLIIGNPFESLENPDDELSPFGSAGAVYSYTLNSEGLWQQRQKLTSPDKSSDSGFGWNIQLHNEYLVVGEHMQIDSSHFYKTNGNGLWGILENQKQEDEITAVFLLKKEKLRLPASINDKDIHILNDNKILYYKDDTLHLLSNTKKSNTEEKLVIKWSEVETKKFKFSTQAGSTLSDFDKWSEEFGSDWGYYIGDKILYKGELYVAIADEVEKNPEQAPDSWEKKVIESNEKLAIRQISPPEGQVTYGKDGYIVYYKFLEGNSVNYQRTTEEFSKIINEYREEELRSMDRVIALKNLGAFYEINDDSYNAKRLYEEALDYLKNNNQTSNSYYSDLLFRLGLILEENGSYELAEESFNEAVNINSMYGFEEQNIAPLYKLGEVMAFYEIISKAESFFNSALDIIKSKKIEGHNYHAKIINGLARVKEYNDFINEAEQLYIDAIKISDKNKSSYTSDDHAWFLLDLATFYYEQDQVDSSEEFTKKVLDKPDINESIRIAALENFEVVLLEKGRISESIAVSNKLLNAYKEFYGETSTEYITRLSETVWDYIGSGEYQKADSVLDYAINIATDTYGKESTIYADLLLVKGNLYEEINQYKKVEPLYLKAIEIYKRQEGMEQLNYNRALQSLAGFHMDQNQLAKAERLYLQVEQFFEKNYDDEDADHIVDRQTFLNDLAKLYEWMGRYNEAETHYLKTIEEVKADYGEDHHYNITHWLNLGNLYSQMGRYNDALTNLKKATNIHSRTYGENNIDYAIIISSMASIHEGLEKDEAEALYLQALKIIKTAVGKNHYLYSSTSLDLAHVYMESGKYEKAEKLLLEVLNVNAEIIDENHALNFSTLISLGILYELKGNIEQAERYYSSGINNLQDYYRQNLIGQSEQERKNLLHSIDGLFKAFMDFALRNRDKNPALKDALFDFILFKKDLLVSGTAQMQNQILNSGDSLLIAEFHHWILLRKRISQAQNSDLDTQKELDMDKLKDEANALEKQLTRHSKSSSRGTINKKVKWQQIQQVLKPGEVAIEMLRIEPLKSDSSLWYAALYITPNTTNPQVYIYKNGKQLESKFITYYRSAIGHQVKDEASYKIFWEPLKNTLPTNTETVYFSGDGVFYQVSFDGLFNAKSQQFLNDEINFVRLTSTKNLIIEGREEKMQKTKAILFGRPDYNFDDSKPEQKEKDDGQRNAVYFKEGIFPDLPGTQQEIENITSAFEDAGWEVSIKSGKQATEEALKEVDSPTVLHLATHGFFLQEEDLRGVTGESNVNPLFQSGIVLAGISDYLTAEVKPTREDGILSGYEAQTLNLNDTKLVVLSACQTGLGKVDEVGGFYGLQRTLQVAGAENFLLSLWSVDDKATQEFMSSFYKFWLDGLNENEALAETQKVIKKKYPHPYYWAAFVLVK